jgi:hypothetical protein
MTGETGRMWNELDRMTPQPNQGFGNSFGSAGVPPVILWAFTPRGPAGGFGGVGIECEKCDRSIRHNLSLNISTRTSTRNLIASAEALSLPRDRR